MRPTYLKSGLFWVVCLAGLSIDWLTKIRWGEIYYHQNVWAGWALVLMLGLFLSRVAVARLSIALEVGLALLTAGILGNALDVIIYQGVRDWIQWFGWRTNLADILIWLGLLLWFWVIKNPSAVGPERE